MKKLIQKYQSIFIKAIFGLLLIHVNNVIASTVEVSNINSGWFSSRGEHDNLNRNYSASENHEYGQGYRNFFTFDLSGIEVDNAVGATFTIYTYSINTIHRGDLFSSGLFTLYDVSTSLTDLNKSYQAFMGDWQSIYSDLGSGDVYGSVSLHPMDSESFVTITLNSNFIKALKSSNGVITVGGMFEASPPIGTDGIPFPPNFSDKYHAFGFSDFNVGNVLTISTVPEPENEYLFALGLFFIGVTTLKRRYLNK